MVYSQKRCWGYDEDGNWNSVQGQELPDGWTHDNPSDPTIDPLPTPPAQPEAETEAEPVEGA